MPQRTALCCIIRTHWVVVANCSLNFTEPKEEISIYQWTQHDDHILLDNMLFQMPIKLIFKWIHDGMFFDAMLQSLDIILMCIY